MHSSSRSAALALVALIGAACSDGTKEQSPGEVLARDSTLSSGLKQADTSGFAEPTGAATFDPESAMSPPPKVTKPTTATSAPRAAVPTPRRPMRPAPATIHPDPIPTHLPPAGGNATAILERVPGAALPPARPRRAKVSAGPASRAVP